MSRQSLTWTYTGTVMANQNLYETIRQEVFTSNPNATQFKIWGFTLVASTPTVIETANHGKIGTLEILGAHIAHMPTNQNGQGGVVTKMVVDTAGKVTVNVFYDMA